MSASNVKSPEEFRFLLLGKTGCGKSTTGNTILGADLFDSDVSFESVTSECNLKRSRTDERMVEIMDSPGLFDTGKKHEEISSLVMQALACMHPGPDAVFYVMKIGRYTDEEFGVYTRLKALLDENVTRYLIVLFTHGDALKGKSMEDMLKKAPAKLRDVLSDCSGRFVVVDNIHRDDRSQVEGLLTMVKDLRRLNGGLPYQCPKYATLGDRMEEEVNRRMAVVETKELQNKKHVQELNATLEKTQEKANQEREEFDRKEQEREAAMAEQHKETEGKLRELGEQLKQKNVSEEQQKQAMADLKAHLQETENRQKEEYKKQRDEELKRMEQLNQEKEQFMQELMRTKEEETRRLAEQHREQMENLKDEISKLEASQQTAQGGGCTIL